MIALPEKLAEEVWIVVEAEMSKTAATWVKVIREKVSKDLVSLYQIKLGAGLSYYKIKQILGTESGLPSEEEIKRAYDLVSSPNLERKPRGRRPGNTPLPTTRISDLKLEPVEVERGHSRRNELAVYRTGSSGLRVEAWKNLAAGYGEDLERASDLSVLDAPAKRGIHAIRIRGESMDPTLTSGDTVLVETFDGGVELPSIEMDEPKNSLKKFRTFVRDDEIYVIQINDEGPTVKRLQFDVAAGELDWVLQVIPDNMRSYRVRAIKRKDRVRVLARVIGLVEA